MYEKEGWKQYYLTEKEIKRRSRIKKLKRIL